MQYVTQPCQRCGQNYNPEWKSDCAAGVCLGPTWGPRPVPRPDPDHLMRLLTSLERRLLDAECGYVELEQGLSVQEEETRKLREQVNRQWAKIDKLEETCQPVARDEAEDKAGCHCDDYAAILNNVTFALDAAEKERDKARAERDNVVKDCKRWETLRDHYAEALDTAAKAAAEYHAAWQDAAEDKSLYGTAVLACVRKDQEIDEARAFAQRCWAYVIPSAQRRWLDTGQVPDWIKSDAEATSDD